MTIFMYPGRAKYKMQESEKKILKVTEEYQRVNVCLPKINT